MHPDSIEKFEPEKTLDYYVQRRNGRKRDYIYSYGASRSCPHSHLTEIVVGSGDYRCDDCNYVFTIVAAKQKPMHHVIIQAMQTLLHGAKEYGAESIQEMLRTPLGQYNGAPQKAVLPEGMSVDEAMMLLEEVDVNTEDGGAAQLKELRDAFWVSDKSRQRRIDELEGMDEVRRSPQAQKWLKEQGDKRGGSQARRVGTATDGSDDSGRGDVPSLSEAEGADTPTGD